MQLQCNSAIAVQQCNCSATVQLQCSAIALHGIALHGIYAMYIYLHFSMAFIFVDVDLDLPVRKSNTSATHTHTNIHIHMYNDTSDFKHTNIAKSANLVIYIL